MLQLLVARFGLSQGTEFLEDLVESIGFLFLDFAFNSLSAGFVVDSYLASVRRFASLASQSGSAFLIRNIFFSDIDSPWDDVPNAGWRDDFLFILYLEVSRNLDSVSTRNRLPRSSLDSPELLLVPTLLFGFLLLKLLTLYVLPSL